jgi:ABC-type histidine transport system ATPase subunit
MMLYATLLNKNSLSMTIITVDNLYKAFREQPILQGVSFTAKQGDVVALLGSSGSGKSTLLRCINLLTVPQKGKLIVNHHMMNFTGDEKIPLTTNQLIALRTKVGMVFQQFNLWAHMTVIENLIEAPIHVLKQNKNSACEQAEELLKKVGLMEKKNCYPHELSGGQQQRAAIARALMMKPDVMLFDEPTSALDPEVINEVLVVMQKLAAEGMTMIVATHELGFAKRVASHAIFLDAGKIVEQGNAAAMFDHPQTERFRRFLEAMQH